MVESFRAITDVRSNFKHEINLLHFIFETIEQKLPDVLKLRKEISAVFEAVKFSRTEMEAELKAIQEMLREIETELITQKTKVTTKPLDPEPASTVPSKSGTKIVKCKGDKFVEVVESFLATARKQLAEIEKSNADMIKKVNLHIKFYIKSFNLSVYFLCKLLWRRCHQSFT